MIPISLILFMFAEEKSEALKILVEQMDKEKDAVLLRHGTLRKTHLDGANLYVINF